MSDDSPRYISYTSAAEQIHRELHRAEVLTIGDDGAPADELYAYRLEALTSILRERFPTASAEQVALIETYLPPFNPDQFEFGTDRLTKALMREFPDTRPLAAWD